MIILLLLFHTYVDIVDKTPALNSFEMHFHILWKAQNNGRSVPKVISLMCSLTFLKENWRIATSFTSEYTFDVVSQRNSTAQIAE